MPCLIRRAGPEDTVALAALKLRTFRETFVEGDMDMGYDPDNLAHFEAESYGEPAVAAQLADPRRAQWVAVAADGTLMGYAHAGPCKLPHPDAEPTHGELYQFYVARKWQGAGVGRTLLDAALGWLAEEMPGPVWLGVFSGNHRAQKVYAARGFAKVGEYAFKVGEQYDHEFIFRRD
ncbi:GNAT family N-acetyltransferase [Sphingobium subterraneum]|uniref:Ribosomal protein S18 acetylase RimI-like enzyme n=1 Tax=Sphingobium subterraneum TaxID=627688 RepID=A0A841J8I0_9SPHN|nr:GNAT family N-acetyltransferase [Sphingobium subterraneum]MBB6124825.1 ribosomal protein S18 acetylase RimI-like enzyme [Sphingobium subterraneum]